MNRQDFWRRPQALLLTAVVAFGIGGAAIASADRLHPALDLKIASADEGPSRTGFAPVVKKVLPSVVSVASSKVSKVPTGFFGGEMPDDPLFRQFFGRGQRQMSEQRERGLGSGVILTPDGYILTNNHVVDGATDIVVTVSDKRDFKAKVIGTDPKSDLAVLKIDAAGLPNITIGDSSKVQVGDYALAVGNPFGVGQTVTMGIISATGRSHMGIEEYEDFIQTDAPINPGNSGGALVNDRGELIGINTAILAHGSEGNQGIGFAIPAKMARSVMDQIVRTGEVTRAYLGIVRQDVTPSIAKAFGQKDLRGALVGDVSANSPAQRGGVQKGDIIESVNGKPVMDSNDLRMTISMMAPDSNVKLHLLRDGADRDLNVKLGELTSTEASSAAPQREGSRRNALSGVQVEDASNGQGVVVTQVSPSSVAADAGLQRGDVIQEVNRKPVKNTSDFERAMSASKDETLLLVNRRGNTMYLAV